MITAGWFMLGFALLLIAALAVDWNKPETYLYLGATFLVILLGLWMARAAGVL